MNDIVDPEQDPWSRLRAFTSARIGMARCGDGISTTALLQFQADHATARDVVKRDLQYPSLSVDGSVPIEVHSAATDRSTYIRRPDLGRRLAETSRALLASKRAADPWDAVFVIADGLSSAAIEAHAQPVLQACIARLTQWRLAPVILARQARVALGDEIGELLNANQSVVLIGERPGLSAADSLGIYLTWHPRAGRRDADRNCISNVREPRGLSYAQAADKVSWLMTEARRRRLSGTSLKEDALETERFEHWIGKPAMGRIQQE